jgi:hypothetical protein
VRVVATEGGSAAGSSSSSSSGRGSPLQFESGIATDSAADDGEGFEGRPVSWSAGEEEDGDSDSDDDDLAAVAAAAAAVRGGGGGGDSSLHGAGLMRGAVDKFVAAEAGVSPKEILPMVRGVVGLQDRTRMGMLLEVLTMCTPIKVRVWVGAGVVLC